MRLENAMLYSLLALIQPGKNIEIEGKIKHNYVEMLLQTNIISEFFKIINSDIFYGEKGARLFEKGEKIKIKMYNMPSPYDFEKVLYDIKDYIEEVKQIKNYATSKIEDVFFWSDGVDAVDQKIDEQEKNFFEKLSKIDIVTSCMYSKNLNINIVKPNGNNANDIQSAYRAMLIGTDELDMDAWIISQIIAKNQVVMYALRFINDNEYDKYIMDIGQHKYAQNLWGTYEDNVHNYNVSNYDVRNLKERYLYVGKGRLTNVTEENCTHIWNNEIVSMFDVSKNRPVNIEQKNPFKIISDYVTNDQIRFSIKPELFVELLNMQLLNRY